MSMRRIGPATESALGTLALIVGVGIVLSVLSIVPQSAPAADQASAPTGISAGQTTGNDPALANNATLPSGKHAHGAAAQNAQTATGPASAAVPAARPGLACTAGQNGGSTDTGVDATSIKLAATTV